MKTDRWGWRHVGRWLLCAVLMSGVLLSAGHAEELQPTTTEGVLRVGMEANYAPFNWSQADDSNGAVPISNSSGEYANGYDVWMAKKLAQALGLELEIVKIEWDGLPPALISGKIDAIIAGMSPTAERKEILDFTDVYYTSDLVLVVRRNSAWADASSLSDFSGARVTGQLNTFHYGVIDQIPGAVKETAMESFPTMISALASEKIDAYVSERPGAMAAVAANPPLSYVAFEPGEGFDASLEDTAVAVSVRKGSPLSMRINEALGAISEEERQAKMQQMILYHAGLEMSGEAPAERGFFTVMGDLISEYGALFLRGAGVTMLISVLGTVIGFVIGLFVQVLRIIPIDRKKGALRNFMVRVLRLLLNIYIEVFRGTPMMVQAMLIYYGSKLFFGIDMSSMWAALLIVSVNTGAYLAEVIRGGIDSVDSGQLEACKAIGLTHGQMMRCVILPQTIKAILPSIGNEFVVNIKDTSVLNVISVTELFFVTKSVAGSTLQIFQTYFITAVIYLVLTLVTTRLINYIGKKNGQVKPFSLSSVTGGTEL
ncbi:MAG: ABC transporter permease subunit [Ndongobacter sp.]|nr:ABC transporter permease subunit [Ndongobacter sp.]